VFPPSAADTGLNRAEQRAGARAQKGGQRRAPHTKFNEISEDARNEGGENRSGEPWPKRLVSSGQRDHDGDKSRAEKNAIPIRASQL